MASDITFKDLISNIEIRPLKMANLAASVTITIADAISIICLLRKTGDTYAINWPSHQDKKTQQWYKDVYPRYDYDAILTKMVIEAYERKINPRAPVIGHKVKQQEEDPFNETHME